MLGLFIAGLALSTVVVAVSLLGPAPAVGASRRTLRFWTLQLGGFGVTGAGLSLAGVAAPWALVIALVASGLVARLVHPLLEETSDDVGLGWLSGASARVVLPIGARRGKIAIDTARGRLELPARSDDGRAIERGRPVFVAWVEHGEAYVVDLRRSERAAQALPDEAPLPGHHLAEQDGRDGPAA